MMLLKCQFSFIDSHVLMRTGRTKYQITGCAGQGAFAEVYKAYVNCNPDDVVALKVYLTSVVLSQCYLEIWIFSLFFFKNL